MSEAMEMLVANYRDYADAHGAATERGDYKVVNSNYDKLLLTYRKICALGAEGQNALRCLMNDNSKSVACWAATHSLSFAEREALEVLDGLSKQGGVIAFSAEMTARQWRSGQLEI